MSPSYDQDEFWRGEFGDSYTARNQGPERIAANLSLFSRALGSVRDVESVLELGANVGLNLIALQQLLPHARLAAVEINAGAAAELRRRLPMAEVHLQSVHEFRTAGTWDLVLTKGLLIHLAPETLPSVYAALHRSSGRYILLAEYYNPAPVEVPYRGHAQKLFKRDFAGELLTQFADLRLRDYGFVYHRDPLFPQDDLNWFLLEKTLPSQ